MITLQLKIGTLEKIFTLLKWRLISQHDWRDKSNNYSPVGSTTDSQELFEINSSGDELFLPVVQASNISVTNSIVSNSTSIAESTGVSITGSSGGTSSGSSY